MAQYSNGKQPVFLREPIEAGERKWYPVSWERLYPDSEIVTSSWPVPDGFTVLDKMTNVFCAENGETFTKCNRVLLETTLTEGIYFIPNETTTTNNKKEIEGFYLTVKSFQTP